MKLIGWQMIIGPISCHEYCARITQACPNSECHTWFLVEHLRTIPICGLGIEADLDILHFSQGLAVAELYGPWSDRAADVEDKGA